MPVGCSCLPLQQYASSPPNSITPPPRRTRAEADKAAAKTNAVVEVVTAWLPLLDSFDAALQAQEAAEARGGPPPPGEAEVHAAYRALHKQLLELLRCGVGWLLFCLLWLCSRLAGPAAEVPTRLLLLPLRRCNRLGLLAASAWSAAWR